ncbi:hypothetical protein B0H66DRAFT_279193 [Apodospora peruviana]|uniref:Uncharacterized protein n=1 Tax=Apodospora peruviana TaxID=516989 RepID=A0AAE0I0G6_9PEZI|nr:hypothetical protein B0H66DRAFT_279193 [Apodospora peruviana]
MQHALIRPIFPELTSGWRVSRISRCLFFCWVGPDARSDPQSFLPSCAALCGWVPVCCHCLEAPYAKFEPFFPAFPDFGTTFTKHHLTDINPIQSLLLSRAFELTFSIIQGKRLYFALLNLFPSCPLLSDAARLPSSVSWPESALDLHSSTGGTLSRRSNWVPGKAASSGCLPQQQQKIIT